MFGAVVGIVVALLTFRESSAGPEVEVAADVF
jgi:hypothetical protein